MYKVCLYNNGVETPIHYSVPNPEAPHLQKLELKEGLSKVDTLSFPIYTDNPGYSSLFELTTKIKVINTADNSTRFTGRVLDIDEKMDNDGKFYKEVLCESALSFLNDSKQRANTFVNNNVTDFLIQILAIHNSKVEDAKKIQPGNVDVTALNGIAYTCSFKTTLETILEVAEKCNIDGNIRVRENNGLLYFDWLQNFSNNTIDVRLGKNMQDMVKSKDVTSLGSHIVPIGANNLTIESVNGGLDYIEDSNARNTFGVIEKIVEYKDITTAQELYDACLSDLSDYTQPLYSLECNAIDLFYLTGNTINQFLLGANLHIVNPVMAIDSIYNVVGLEMDLLQPYNPKLTISNFPIKLSSEINDLRKSTISNDGVYNNVQIGDSFGIRAVRSDGKVITTLNATEGISIENGNIKVFYVDENGKLRAIEGIFDDVTANNMIANEMRTSNTSSYIVFHDQYMEFFKNSKLIMKLGFDPLNAFPTVELVSNDGITNGIGITGAGALEPLGNMEFNYDVDFYGTTRINGENIAPQKYVYDAIAAHVLEYHSMQ